MTVNYLIWSVIQPSHCILLAAVFGLVAWKTRFGNYCRNVAALLIVIFGFFPTGSQLLRPLESRFEIPPDTAHVDGIIVLGGAEHRRLSRFYNQPQLNAAGDRLTTFMMLANDYPDARLVFSGEHDAETASTMLLGSGIPPERLTLESESANTCDSAMRTKALLAPEPHTTWLLVTSGFHMPRAVACFRAAGWSIQPYPADFRVGSSPFRFSLVGKLRNLDIAAHEWLGLLYYRVRGWTDDTFPVQAAP